MKKVFGLLLAMVLFMGFNCQAADLDVSALYGYHMWTNSGHTFKYSDKDDKEWNGNASQIEATLWKDNLGIYAYYGEDDKVDEQMYKRYFYEAETSYFGTGVKIKHRFFSCLDGYIGVGINRTVLKNTITIITIKRKWRFKKVKQEDLRCFGPDVILGANWFIIKDFPLYLTVNARYSWNKTNSDMWNETTFDAGGLRMFGGIGYRF